MQDIFPAWSIKALQYDKRCEKWLIKGKLRYPLLAP